MISCIICSRHADISKELNENIASTIGCEYELIIIDNSYNQYSIFSAYNEGVTRSKGDILCFMHEDILYHTQNWGNNVSEYFKKYPEAGLIGVAGTHYLADMPSAQWDSELSSSYLIQGYLIGEEYTTKLCIQDEYRAVPTIMVAVDGLWMCIPSVLFNKLSWDTSTFNGFHAYDTDIAMQVWNIGYEVHLCWDVLIEHQSLGNVNNQFHIACEKLYEKWRSSLPMIKGVTLTYKEQLLCNKLVENKILYRKQFLDYQKLLDSRQFNIGKKIIKPFKVMNSMLKKINKG